MGISIVVHHHNSGTHTSKQHHVPSLHQNASTVSYSQTKSEHDLPLGDENKQTSMQNKFKYVVSQTFKTRVKHISIATINPNK
jgi:hypothetical protein